MRLRRRVRILSLSRGAGHVFRAIMESICYGTEYIFRSMRGNGFEPKEVARVERGMEPEAAEREEYEYYVDKYVETCLRMLGLRHGVAWHVAVGERAGGAVRREI